MEYFLNAGCWSSVFAVPGAVVDEYIKLASGSAVKVLLYTLRNNGRKIKTSEISAALNINEDDVKDAFNFWEGVGILSSSANVSALQDNAVIKSESDDSGRMSRQNNTNNSQETVQKPVQTQRAPENPERAENYRNQGINPAVQISSASFQITPSEIEKMKNASAEMKGLFDLAQQALGNTINHTMVRSLVWQHEYLGLKPDVIIMLLTYCASINKTGTSYIETIAVEWSKNGIDTIDRADREIERLRKQKSFVSKMYSAFGLKRNPTPNQLKFFDEWMMKGYTPDLIECACERTADAGKTLTANYVNGILENWKSKGITTRQQAEEELKSGNKPNRYSSDEEQSYDLSRAEEFAVTFSGNRNRRNQ